MSVKKEINRRSFLIQQESGFLGRESEFYLDKVIPDYTTDLVISYRLLQKNGLPVKLMALVHKMPEMLDLKTIMHNIKNPIRGFITIQDAFIAQLDKEESLIFLVNKPEPNQLLCNNLEFFKGKAEVILQQIAIPILELVSQLHNQNSAHNAINLQNIWVALEEEKIQEITLSNPILEPPGYYQTHSFEERNRDLMHRAGKAYKKEADAYAIGMLILSLFSGNSALQGSYENINHNKIHKGSYRTAIEDWFGGDVSLLPTSLKIVTYWLLQDDLKKRWTISQAVKFLRRRHKKITLSYWNKKTNQDQNLPHTFSLELHGTLCKSPSEAAYLAINHYEEMKVKVKNGKLIKNLINNQQISPNFITNISYLRSIAAKSVNNFLSKDEIFLTFFILALDHNMPLKMQNLAFDPQAIFSFFIFLAHRDGKQTFYSLLDLLLSNLLEKLYIGLSFLGFKALAPLLKLPIDFLSQNYSSLGIKEFILVLVQPGRAFRSRALDNKMIFSSQDLLLLLNSLSDDQLDEVFENERILAWLQAQFFLRKGTIEKDLKVIIANLQADKLPQLADYFFRKISTHSIAKNFHLREEKLKQVKETANTGDFKLLNQVLSDQKLVKDNIKFIKIEKRRKKLQEKLADYTKLLENKKDFLFIGEDLAKKLATSLLLATLLNLSYKLFWLL